MEINGHQEIKGNQGRPDFPRFFVPKITEIKDGKKSQNQQKLG